MTPSEYRKYRKEDVLVTYYNPTLGGEREGNYIIIYAQSIVRVGEDRVRLYPYCMFERLDSISSELKTFKSYTPSEGQYFVAYIESLFEPKENEMREMYFAWKTEDMKKAM